MVLSHKNLCRNKNISIFCKSDIFILYFLKKIKINLVLGLFCTIHCLDPCENLNNKKFLFHSLLCPKRFVCFLDVATYCGMCMLNLNACCLTWQKTTKLFGDFIQLFCSGRKILWAVFFDTTGEECIATICLFQIALPKGLFARKVIKCGEARA